MTCCGPEFCVVDANGDQWRGIYDSVDDEIDWVNRSTGTAGTPVDPTVSCDLPPTVIAGALGDDPNVTVGDPGTDAAIFYDTCGTMWFWDDTGVTWVQQCGGVI